MNANIENNNWKSLVVRILIGIMIMAVAVSIALYWIKNRPRAQRHAPQILATLATVVPLSAASHQVVVGAMGSVVPARRLVLTAQVGGEVLETGAEFYPGGYLQAGKLAVEIDDSDNRLLEREALIAIERADVAIAQSDYKIKQSALAVKKSQEVVAHSGLGVEQSSFNIAKSRLDIEKSVLSIEQSKLLIQQRSADLVRAEQELLLEQGQQQVAKKEFAALAGIISGSDQGLVLRVPQLATVTAALAAARARLADAKVVKKQAEVAKKQADATQKLQNAAKKQAQSQLEQANIASRTAAVAHESAVSARVEAELARDQAQVSLDRARLNIERSRVTAPFDAVVEERMVVAGTIAGAGAKLAKLVATDEYWVTVSVPQHKLKWIILPSGAGSAGSLVKIYHEGAWGQGLYREGRVKRQLANVNSQDRMAALLVAIKDPLDRAGKGLPQMILGSYVRVDIAGLQLDNVYRLPREAIRNQNQAWIMTPEGTLDIRTLEFVWGDNDWVFAADLLTDGDLLITSNIISPAVGMKLRLAGQKDDR